MPHELFTVGVKVVMVLIAPTSFSSHGAGGRDRADTIDTGMRKGFSSMAVDIMTLAHAFGSSQSPTSTSIPLKPVRSKRRCHEPTSRFGLCFRSISSPKNRQQYHPDSTVRYHILDHHPGSVPKIICRSIVSFVVSTKTSLPPG